MLSYHRSPEDSTWLCMTVLIWFTHWGVHIVMKASLNVHSCILIRMYSGADSAFSWSPNTSAPQLVMSTGVPYLYYLALSHICITQQYSGSNLESKWHAVQSVTKISFFWLLQFGNQQKLCQKAWCSLVAVSTSKKSQWNTWHWILTQDMLQ